MAFAARRFETHTKSSNVTGNVSIATGQNQLNQVSNTMFQLVPDSVRKIPPGLLYQWVAVGTTATKNAANTPTHVPINTDMALTFIGGCHLTPGAGAKKNRAKRRLFCPTAGPCYVFGILLMCIKISYIHMEITMRTNIVIDDQLMADALKATGLNTKKEAVEEGLKLLIKRNEQQEIRKLRGKLKWEGNLEEMRDGA